VRSPTPSPADLLDHPLISERYFFPRREPPRSRLDVEVGDATLACALHRADPEGHVVVHFHGNGEVVADWQDGFPEVIGQLGWDLLLAEYRGYGGSSGSPQLGRMLADVEAVMRAAGPPERVVVLGRSPSPIRWSGCCCGSARASSASTPRPSRRRSRRGWITGPSSAATQAPRSSCTPGTTGWWT
jgi:hypothetical protein